VRVLCLLLLFFSNYCIGQNSDTTSKKLQNSNLSTNTIDTTFKKKSTFHKPFKAFLFSAALPGLGQAYNKKYWKIPIIYAGFGVASYFLYDQNKKYQCYRKAYIMKVDDNPYTDGICNGFTETSQLEQGKNFHRRNVDLISALMVVWYGLNLVDAVVDAHLFHFDVSDDLSLNIAPDFRQYHTQNQNITTFGLQIKLNM
jgi:hypothetical protein